VSGEPESRLGELFAELPQPESEVTERALARALAALPRPHAFERPARALAFLLAAALALLAVAAGALAAAGALHVSFGRETAQSQPGRGASTSQLTVPRGAGGIAATVDGRLWLTTAGGLRLQGLPVTAAALSPHALYVAAGIGRSLVAMAPSGRRAWSHPTPGPVVAIAWAPDGLRIVYVVEVHGAFRLYAIEGNGGKNGLLDAAVRATPPAWRADSLAIAYVAAGGRPVVYDFGRDSRTVIAAPAARGADFLSFTPNGGRRLALATAHAVLVTGPVHSRAIVFRDATVAGLGWIRGNLAVGLNGHASTVRLFRVGTGLVQTGRFNAPARIEALDLSGSRLTLAVASRSGLRVLSTTGASPARAQLLLQLPPAVRITSLATR